MTVFVIVIYRGVIMIYGFLRALRYFIGMESL